MAGKKKEASLQMSVTNQEQWEEMLATKGLTVVDVYQQWCGPCRAVVSLLRKIKNELGDDLLHFATAEADSIDALERYRGKCEPTFLFYGGGELVVVLRGANAPLLQRAIVEELAKEKLVLERGGERSVVQDDALEDEETAEEEEVLQQTEYEENIVVPASKSYTVAIIKPDAVAHGKANEIIMKVYFEDLVQFMSSGLSHILVLSQAEDSVSVVSAWHEFIGPADIEEAKREKPESLRAQYGTQALFNAVHGSEDIDQASRELTFLFPNFRTASVTEQDGEEEHVERTLALIRPDVAKENREKILAKIYESGFTVALKREVTLTEDQVRQFYFQHIEEEFFPALLKSMTSGPVLALALTRPGAVEHWKSILGSSDVNEAGEESPEWVMMAVEDKSISSLHGSANQEDAEREISFFFPKQQTLAVIKPDATEEHKEKILEEISGRGFTVRQQKEEVLTRETAEEFYKEHREKPFFSQLVEFMCSGSCLMLVLSKENAVEDWRAMMGPTDPVQAKETSPNSLRARFASDILHNSVHGSSTEAGAEEEIRLIFGEISSDSELAGDGETDKAVSEKDEDNPTDDNSEKSRSSTEGMSENKQNKGDQDDSKPGSPQTRGDDPEDSN
ncbi:thioredoxin domain-containing protein 6 isoform X2 [Cheilinus undulatus]|uniref:thioredoxin domain-containing protein 6 isoform X2 n=1 Tax=Cheilinus undulatus TaxID=241271 RepID=UPI001BD34578|nr:thioredoxin domain-containing protein 6 isoform X2 [Cheilinus undulatus]